MRILLLQAGFNELGVIDWFHKAGHEVIAIGNQVGLIGQQCVDEYICLDYTDRDAVLALAREKQIDRVCACCNDAAVLTATYVAGQLGLSGYDTVEAAEIIAHKDKFKRFASENQIMSVPTHDFSDIREANAYAQALQEYPVIVKPVDLSGGKGIRKCQKQEELLAAIEEAFAVSRSRHIVIEPYVEGSQHGFCAFLHQQRVVACCSNDEISVVNPYRVEIDLFPATGIEQYKTLLIAQVEKIARKLSLVDGIFHLQFIRTESAIYIIEAMRRIIGNMYSVPASMANGFDWDAWEAQALIGTSCDGIEEKMDTHGYYAYRALIAPENGILKEVRIAPWMEPYIVSRIMLEEPGATITNYQTSTIGILFFAFTSREEMHNVMIDSYQQIQICMEAL